MNTTQNINVSLTISRNNQDEITIEIQDNASFARFLKVTLTPHDFAMAVTGLSHIKAPASVSQLAVVGMKKITEKRSVICPIDAHDKEQLRQWLLDTQQEVGWNIDGYLGSQDSVRYRQDSQCELHYRVFRYEPQTQETSQ